MSEPTSAQNGRVIPTRATTRSMTRMTEQRVEWARVQRANRSSILNSWRVSRLRSINGSSTTSRNPQDAVRDHFSRMRSRSSRCQPAAVSKGINEINCPINDCPPSSSVLKNTLRTHPDSFKCTSCAAILCGKRNENLSTIAAKVERLPCSPSKLSVPNFGPFSLLMTFGDHIVSTSAFLLSLLSGLAD